MLLFKIIFWGLMAVYASYVIFSIVCFFRKSCKWKMCPFRCRRIGEDLNLGGCKKCPYPYDEKERAAIKNALKILDKLSE